MYDAIARHKVTHLCGAPIVMATLLNAPADEKKPLPHVVEFFTAAAPPPEAVLAAMKAAGFNVTHLYGLTETYGPAAVRAGGDEGASGRALRAARGTRRARPRHARAGAVGRRKHGRGDVPRQRRDEGLPQEQVCNRKGVCRRLVSFRRPR